MPPRQRPCPQGRAVPRSRFISLARIPSAAAAGRGGHQLQPCCGWRRRRRRRWRQLRTRRLARSAKNSLDRATRAARSRSAVSRPGDRAPIDSAGRAVMPDRRAASRSRRATRPRVWSGRAQARTDDRPKPLRAPSARCLPPGSRAASAAGRAGRRLGAAHRGWPCASAPHAADSADLAAGCDAVSDCARPR